MWRKWRRNDDPTNGDSDVFEPSESVIDRNEIAALLLKPQFERVRLGLRQALPFDLVSDTTGATQGRENIKDGEAFVIAWFDFRLGKLPLKRSAVGAELPTRGEGRQADGTSGEVGHTQREGETGKSGERFPRKYNLNFMREVSGPFFPDRR